MIPYYTKEDVRQALPMGDLIEAMEKALIAFSRGEVIQPVRTMLPVESEGGFFGVMPALMEGAMGTKLVTFYPGNAGTAHETHQALISLFDPKTGAPLATMDGGLITEMRTAAVSAVATRALAPRDAHVLAILGSGVQARSHVEALSHVGKFDEVRIWSQTTANAERLASEIGARSTSAKEAVEGADVVVTVTSSQTPVLEGAWLKPGAHVNAVGACIPTWRELDDAVMKNVVIADSRDAALQESGDIILSGATIAAELGEVSAGSVHMDASQTTVFKSLGMAVEDVAAARLVYDRINKS